MNQIVITLPLPPRQLSPNGYKHWRTVSAAKKEYRAVALMYGRMALPTDRNHHLAPVWPCKARVSFEWFLHRDVLTKGLYRPLDVANGRSALKAAIDGLCDSGVIYRDSHEWLEEGETILHRSKKTSNGKPRIELTIEYIS